MSNDFVRFSFPNIQEMCIDISSHKLQWKLSVDFSCLDGSMPHHHLKHLLGYTLAKDDGTGKSVPRHMAADGELAAKCQSDSLQILVVLLYAGNGWFVACPLEYLLCVGEDRHNKFLSSLDSARTDEGMAIKIDDMFRVAEFAGISESHTCEYLEQEKVEIPVVNRVRRLVAHLDELLNLGLVKMRTLTILSALVHKAGIRVFSEKTDAVSLCDVRLETLVVVVDGCLCSLDLYACFRVFLLAQEHVEDIYVVQRNVRKGLELAKTLQCPIGHHVPLSGSFPQISVLDALLQPYHEANTVPHSFRQVCLENVGSHGFFVELHADEDFLTVIDMFLNDLVQEHGIGV